MDSKKILIIDDSRILLKALSMKLKATGYQVLTAEDGGEAIRIVRLEKPDLILLDIRFPPDVAHGGGVPWDGFLIMDWLRRMDEGQGIPIIVMTVADPLQCRDRCLQAGAVAFFHKPVNNDELLAAIERTLGETVAEGEPLNPGS